MTSDIDKLEKKLIGLNIHSVYTLCNECHTWGVNVPLNHECGNCGSKDTTVYYDIETIKSFLAKAIETAKEEERERIFSYLVKADVAYKYIKEYQLTGNDRRWFFNGTNAMLTELQKYIDNATATKNLKEKGVI